VHGEKREKRKERKKLHWRRQKASHEGQMTHVHRWHTQLLNVRQPRQNSLVQNDQYWIDGQGL
jgi:hypothetical protein